MHSMSKVDLTHNPSLHLPSLWAPYKVHRYGFCSQCVSTVLCVIWWTILLEWHAKHSFHFLVLHFIKGIFPLNLQHALNYLGNSTYKLWCFTQVKEFLPMFPWTKECSLSMSLCSLYKKPQVKTLIWFPYLYKFIFQFICHLGMPWHHEILPKAFSSNLPNYCHDQSNISQSMWHTLPLCTSSW